VRRLKALAWFIGFCILILPALTKLGAQQPIRYVVMDDYIRDILARDWDAHAADWPQYERGYCLGYQLDFYAGEVAYRVTQIAAPDSVKASVGGISFSCTGKFSGHLAEMHTHPPTSCASIHGPCFKGGAYAYQCEPSDQDRRWLNTTPFPFSMIQCSREATISWMPDPLDDGEESEP
jgi:hypothetical protein